MLIDYEAEYNNRDRVPEHPQIFARWERDSAAYRAKALVEEGAALGLPYGDSPRQTIDLFFPDTTGKTPLALFIHGGYWRALHPSVFSHLARGLNAQGVTVAIAGYDLCPQVGVGDIIAQMRAACLFLWKRFSQPIMVYGHSAGGHLAGCMVATDWKTLDPKAPDTLVPAAYSISGVFDLSPLMRISMNVDLRLDEPEARAVSPVFWPAPKGRVFDSIVGGNESDEFRRQAKIIVDAWQPAGVEARYEAVPGANHFTVLDPLTDPNSAMVARLAALCAVTERAR